MTTTLRESCNYLRDAGYDQTAQLMTMAADEIERLNARIRVLEGSGHAAAASRRPVSRSKNRPAIRAAGPAPRRRLK